MTGRTTALVALSSASLLVASGCGADRVDRRDLETKVSDFILKQTGSNVSVKCPNDVDPDKGHKTTCVADLSGTPTNLLILFTSKGRFQVQVDTSHLG